MQPFLSISYDEGAINASAEGVNIFTVLHLIKDQDGRLKISNITCNAFITKMRAKFSGTLGCSTLYWILSMFIAHDCIWLTSLWMKYIVCSAFAYLSVTWHILMCLTGGFMTSSERYWLQECASSWINRFVCFFFLVGISRCVYCCAHTVHKDIATSITWF